MMDKSILVDRRVLGTESHLLSSEEGYAWIDSIPQGVWHLSGQIKNRSPACFDSLCRLNGVTLQLSPGDKWVKSMSTLKGGHPPWGQVMPREAFRRFTEGVLAEANENFPLLSRDYYRGTWIPSGGILNRLVPAKINPARAHEIISEAGMNSRSYEGLFGPNGETQPITYDRFGTRTGRLTVQTGPPILTLKRQYRDVFASSFPGGKILSLDFSALEARILLYAGGGECPDEDLYGSFAQELFGDRSRRKIVKGAILAEVYGASKATLASTLNIDWGDLEVFTRRIRDAFRLSHLRGQIRSQFEQDGFVLNHYGRKIQIENPKDHILVNSFSQSSGVDVSLLGFTQVSDRFLGDSRFKPLFVLHDALIADVHPDLFHEVSSIPPLKIPHFDGLFPLKVEDFSS
jgi:hypothetical protein